MARTVKTLLANFPTPIFKNWNDVPGSEIKAVHISICNTSSSSVDVYLSFVVISGEMLPGAIYSKKTIAANSTESIEIQPRIIAMDEMIWAYASVPNVVSLSLDLVGDIEQENLET